MSRFSEIRNWELLSAADREAVFSRPAVEMQGELVPRVREILGQVKANGDGALFRLTAELDRVILVDLEVKPEEWRAARRLVTADARKAIERAAAQIERFHRALVPAPVRVEVSPGLICGKFPRPIERVGLYIPGGSAPLPSTVLMLGVPAALAESPTRILCTPPRRDGGIDPHILCAAEVCGIERVFKIGGAQAIAAMAFGTRSVPKVDKIFGPGNAWVTEAKSQVSADPNGAAIDMPAGPSEVLVVADRLADPTFVAADLLSQAEHGPDSQVILVSDSRELLEATLREVESQLSDLPRREIALASLGHSRFVLVPDLATALDVSNRYAPEHLILQVEDASRWADRVTNAGSVFIGRWAAEAMGDYASGTNHVLPTYGMARVIGGVSVDSFMKQITYQSLSADALRELGPVVEQLATLEGLDAHRRAVSVRLQALSERGVEQVS
jgi:histidinol dehydrogenase